VPEEAEDPVDGEDGEDGEDGTADVGVAVVATSDEFGAPPPGADSEGVLVVVDGEDGEDGMDGTADVGVVVVVATSGEFGAPPPGADSDRVVVAESAGAGVPPLAPPMLMSTQLTKSSSVVLHTQSHRKVTMPVSRGSGTESV